MDDSLNLFPAWKQTVKEINQMFQDRVEEGEELEFMLEHSFFEKSLNIHNRKKDLKGSEEYYKNITSVKDRLLKEHSILLDSIRSVGYLVLHPNKQGEDAHSDLLATLESGIERCSTRLNNADIKNMDKKGLKGLENANMRLSMHLHSFYQDKKRLPKKFDRKIKGVGNDEDKEE